MIQTCNQIRLCILSNYRIPEFKYKGKTYGCYHFQIHYSIYNAHYSSHLFSVTLRLQTRPDRVTVGSAGVSSTGASSTRFLFPLALASDVFESSEAELVALVLVALVSSMEPMSALADAFERSVLVPNVFVLFPEARWQGGRGACRQ